MSEENQQVAKTAARLPQPGFTFLPQTWDQLFAYAKEIAGTDFVPKAMANKPGAVLAAWQKGQEVGLPPMAALDSIAIINGRPSIHSDGYWAIIASHPLCEWFDEDPPDVALKQGFGRCVVQRRGNPHPTERRFSMEMAKTAKLLDKDNWKNYPGVMLMWRARHLAGDGAIPEAAAGLIPADVARDLEPRDVTPKDEPLRKPQAVTDARTGNGDHSEALADKPPSTSTEETTSDGKKKPKANGKDSALEWVATTTDEDIVEPNSLNAHLKGLSQTEQLEVCKAYNARRQAILTAAQDTKNAPDA